MSNSADFLLEIHTEELPPKSLLSLSNALLTEIQQQLRKNEIAFNDSELFATPRRLGFLIKNVAIKQPDAMIERKGPTLENAFDKEGQPTQACIGFARSCGVTPQQLKKVKTPAGTWVSFQQKTTGKPTSQLLPKIIEQALDKLPIPKNMRWGNHTIAFVRPVHAVILLFGKDVISTSILGCQTDRKTTGHRFLSKGWLQIRKPQDYSIMLQKKGFVIPNFQQRKEKIRDEVKNIIKKTAKKDKLVAVIDENLLDEVTGLVEWPVAFLGSFDKKFLDIPQEVLISAMQDHQRYFPVTDTKNKLMPFFIGVSNIESKEMKRMIAGNERVLKARLADATFFYEVDKKQTLENRIEKLKNIIFHAKLGTLHDKAIRVAKLAEFIASKMGVEPLVAYRAGLLAKTDLTSDLVAEFPELQGIAGYYYAKHDKESDLVCKALKEQYLPSFSGDILPTTPMSTAVALADKLDTLVGIFGINQMPTGEKDPFGSRRAAIGILRMLIEKKLNLDLRELLEIALKNYQQPLENKTVIEDILKFIFERLKPWYQEKNISPDVYAAVAAIPLTSPYDFHCRIQAVQAFKKMSEAEALSTANKRVSNILAKYNKKIVLTTIDEKLFEHDAERVLVSKLQEQQNTILTLSKSAEYQKILFELANLRSPVDNFFDHVLVMTEDKARRENRLLMLKKLRELFLNVADIALLQ